MFVKLTDGNEPVIVNSDLVTYIEGMSGGAHCMLYLVDGRTVRVAKPADAVVALLDWAEPVPKKEEARHVRR